MSVKRTGGDPSDDTLWGFVVDLSFSTELPHTTVWLGRGCTRGCQPYQKACPLEQDPGCGMLTEF